MRLAPLALLALIVRVAYVVHYRHHAVIGDALTYHLEAAKLAAGQGFQRAFESVPTAEHPPMQVLLLGGADLLGITGYLGQMLIMAVIGTATVVAIAFLGRAADGDPAGLVAAAIAALYPLLWVVDGTLMSETPYLLLITLVLLAGYGYLRVPTWRRALVLGALIGLATLTRGEAVMLIVLLGAPLAWRAAPDDASGRPRAAGIDGSRLKPRALQFGAVVLAFCVVMSPWTIRNVLTFNSPTTVLIADDGAGVFIGANCHSSYYGPLIGAWDFGCFTKRPPGDESQVFAAYRADGLRYARDHLGRVPLVLAVRLLRQLDLYRPNQSVFLQSIEGRDPTVTRWGLRAYWLLLAFAIAGAVVLRRRGAPLVVLAAPVIMVIVLGILVYGSTRLRVAAEPVLVVLGAVAVTALAERMLVRRRAWVA